ncbi:hypothetical protein CFter6_1878 [Collimonas fungivorans]|uniref:Uncharacterized protein n=1 Tax=Collimonas fungivorans TaxID=158899 RepID=A0A127PA10_9BURK|nr:hypothetical protein [Collimonas fungivorans]AMO94573.1 hypothetical protein CFter6_1878 [Collimonas fungivorans]
MTDIEPKSSFRGLPLTPEQDAEVRHYITVKKRHGEPWDTAELSAMLKDMLEPPGDDEEEFGTGLDPAIAAAERAAAASDDIVDPIEASEERNAAMESAAMKAQL